MNPLKEGHIAEQLTQLRGFASRYGVLHEAHLLHLKIWPRVLFPTSISSVAKVDQAQRFVKILVKFQDKPPPMKDQKLAVARLLESVQWMLGREWKVEVRINFWGPTGPEVVLGVLQPTGEPEDVPDAGPPTSWARPKV